MSGGGGGEQRCRGGKSSQGLVLLVGGGGGELCVRGTPTQVTWLPSPGSWGLGRFGETWALNSRLLLGWTMILMTKKETWAEKQTGGAG